MKATMKATKDKINAMVMATKQSDFGKAKYSVTDFGKGTLKRSVMDAGRIKKDKPIEEQIQSAIAYCLRYCEEVVSYKIIDYGLCQGIECTVLQTTYLSHEFNSRREAEQFAKNNFDRLYKFWVSPAPIEIDF